MRTLLIAALLLSTDAMACVVLGPEALRIDTTEADGERPQAPTVTVDINRGGRRLESTGCGTSSTSCDDIAFLTLRMTPEDPDSAYAYVIEVVGGDAPTSFGDGEFAWLASGPDMVFHWSDGATVELLHERTPFGRLVARGPHLDLAATAGPAWEYNKHASHNEVNARRARNRPMLVA